MSLLMYMVGKNIPLGTWRKLLKESPSREFYSGWSSKNEQAIARLIVNSCSSMEVVDLVARDWDSLDSRLRIAISFEANDARGTRSNNKTKGLQRLDELLGGRLLRTIDDRKTYRVKKVIDGRITVEDKPVDPATTGAMTSYASYALPSNYNELTPAEKRRVREELAKDRREKKK